jgi:hypothetical protein
MPFELAKAGVVTVTNEYGIRNRQRLSEFGHNIVPALPTIEGIVEGLKEAVIRSKDLEARLAASQFHWPADWDEVFTKVFFDQLFLSFGIESLIG